MPKVSEARKDERRQQILDGARKCFAQNGFERTTIRDLERATSLSTGAIFNYYPTKLDIFIALAAQDAARMAQFWADGGLSSVIEQAHVHNAEMSASYLELGRRVWSDPAFRAKWSDRGAPVVDAVRARLAQQRDTGEVRTDLDLEALVDYTLVTLDGCMLQLRMGVAPRELDPVLALYDQALAPRG